MKRLVLEQFLNLTADQLPHEDVYVQVENLVLDIDASDEVDDARKAFKKLAELTKELINPKTKIWFDKYSKLLIVLKLDMLPVMDPREAVKLVKEFVLTPLGFEDVDVRLKLKYLFSVYEGVPEEVGRIKRDLLTALRENEQLIGKNNIRVGSEKEVAPSVSKWLTDYDIFTKQKTGRGQVERATYIAQSPNTQKLSRSEKTVLLRLLELYDWLLAYKVTEAPGDKKAFGDKIRPAKKTTSLVSPPKPSKSEASLAKSPQPSVSSPKQRPEFTMDKPKSSAPPHKPSVPRAATKTPVLPKTKASAEKFSVDKVEVEKATPSEKSVRQLEKISKEANFMEAPSLSQTIVDAGQEVEHQGNIRMGEMKPSVPVVAKKEEAVAPPPLSKDKKDEKVEQLRKELLEHTVDFKKAPSSSVSPSQKKSVSSPVSAPEGKKQEPQPAEKKVVDLTKRVPLDLNKISSVVELSRIRLSDITTPNFETGLNVLKQKILEIAKTQGLPVRQVAAHFFQSPLYNLYVNMGSAVMNDKNSPDQRTAFARVINNYKMAGKEYLSREQFLAVNRLKKELKQLG